MFITKNPEVALIAEKAGVDRIFVDLEYIGKALRQGGMDTVQNHHTARDVKNVKKVPGAKPGFVIYKTNYTAYVTPRRSVQNG